ncbi:hypothetical protein HZ326_16350 [Fusarium oxysporum f. sp. albedinis]|nr:hypothetical protein HZ326_16350 [Fusarium oxysporum f. sp. albedinis]
MSDHHNETMTVRNKMGNHKEYSNHTINVELSGCRECSLSLGVRNECCRDRSWGAFLDEHSQPTFSGSPLLSFTRYVQGQKLYRGSWTHEAYIKELWKSRQLHYIE